MLCKDLMMPNFPHMLPSSRNYKLYIIQIQVITMLVPLSVNICRYVRFQVLMALNTKDECGPVDMHHHFQGTCYLHLQDGSKH